MALEKIGLIGVGRMGYGIGLNILKHPFQLGLVKRDRRSSAGQQNAARLAEAGAHYFASDKALAEWADVIILCLPSSVEVSEVIFGENGLLQGNNLHFVLIDHTTADPEKNAAMFAAVAERGITCFDAPLSRTPKEALEGKLNCILGNSNTAGSDVLNLLHVYCENIVSLPKRGDGYKLKLVNNLLSIGMASLAAEALAAAADLGISASKLHELVSMGGANSAPFQGMYAFISQQEPDALAFSLENAHKDIKYYLNMRTGSVNHALPQAVLLSLEKAIQTCGGSSNLPGLYHAFSTH